MTADPADDRRVTTPGVLEGGRLVEAIKRLLATPGDLAVDLETSVSRSQHQRRVYVISMAHERGGELVGWLGKQAKTILTEAFGEHLELPPWESPASLCAHNSAFEVGCLLNYDVPLDINCSMMAARCLYLTAVPEGTPQPVEFSLKALVEREFGHVMRKDVRGRDWSRREALDDDGIEYCLEDARWALRLWKLHERRLKDEGLWRGYLDMARSVRATAAINLRGMCFDATAHARLCGKLEREVSDAEQELCRHSGGAVKNHGSTAQVSNWLVEEVLGLSQLTEPKPPKLETLAQFVRRTGKVRADGETRARDLPGRVVDLAGRPHEDATFSAWEAGYLGPRGDMEDRPGPDALLDALADDLNKHTPPVLREEDQAEWDLHEAERAAFELTQAALAERGLEQRRRLLAAFDMRLRARTGHGWRWAPKNLNLKIDKGTMARMPARLRPHWPRCADYLEARARWNRSLKLVQAFGPKLREFLDEDGRIRGQLKVFGTVTGRHTATDPNIQQMPVDKEFRAIFVAPPGRKLVVADYNQIELRLAAVITEDEKLLEIYRAGADVHSETMKVTKVPTRRMAKNINFGVIYGSGAAGLSENIGIPLDEAQVFLARFLDAYKGIARFRETAPGEAERLGYIPIERGRRVLYERGCGLGTCAINYGTQGGAATVQMIALRMVHDALADRPDLDSFVVASVHDEFLLEAPDDDRAREAGEILQDCMRAALLRVFPAAVEMGADQLADAAVIDSWASKP